MGKGEFERRFETSLGDRPFGRGLIGSRLLYDTEGSSSEVPEYVRRLLYGSGGSSEETIVKD